MEKEKNLIENLKKAFNQLVNERQDYLLEKNEEDYFKGYDKDYIDNGVGMQCIRCDAILDEEKALDDAKEQIIEEIEGNYYETIEDLFSKEEFVNSLVEFLKGC